MRKRMVAGATVLAFLVVVGTAEASVGPVKVIGGRAQQYGPTSDGTYLAWTQTSHRGRSAVVLVKRLGTSSAHRLNARGTRGYTGSFLTGTDHQLIYQSVKGWHSDLLIYDLSSGRRHRLPRNVDSRQWEWLPVASSDYVLFLRDVLSRRHRLIATRLMLYNRRRGTVVSLIRRVGRHESVWPGSAGSVYISWAVCRRTCNVFYRNLSTGATRRVPLPPKHAQYSPFIDETANQIYFIRSGPRCGQQVVFRRASLTSPGTSVPVGALPKGYDAGALISVATNPTTMNNDLYFDRYNCRAHGSDIYAFRGVGAS